MRCACTTDELHCRDIDSFLGVASMWQMTGKAPASTSQTVKAPNARRRAMADAFFGLRYVFVSGYAVAVAYLCALAVNPGLRSHAPSWLRWIGAPGSYLSILAVLAFPAGFFLVLRLSRRRSLSSTSLLVLAGLALSALALGMSAYWPCARSQSPFFAPLSWTLGLFVAAVENPFAQDAMQAAQNLAAGQKGCSTRTMPLALEIAKLFAFATTLTTALAAALTLLRSQLDRVAIWRANSLTVVVGIDDDAVSMIRAIASRMAPDETLVLVTGYADRAAVRMAREFGAKIHVTPLQQSETLTGLRFWKRLDQLYLLSEDPGLNHSRLKYIDAAMEALGVDRVRLPLTVRIDDPWQAEVWRRSFLSKEVRWVGDAIGRFETTAVNLVRHVTRTPDDVGGEPPATVLLCGLRPLTYALSSELAQVHREQQLYRKPYVRVPSKVVILANQATSFVHDHDLRQSRLAPGSEALSLIALEADATVETITQYLDNDDNDPHRVAVILVDPSMETEGTRLASRFPHLRVYQASTSATALLDSSIVGRLFPFPINMDLDPHAPHDVWERAAELIHEYYSQDRDRGQPTARPWRELDPFLKESNRRQVINALWMVEKVANHSWNTLENPPAPPLPENFAEMEPVDQLEQLGFDAGSADEMVRLEHEDWRRFYREAGWKHGERSWDRRRHERLKPWDELISENPQFTRDSYRSLVGTLLNLRTLGYRSLPRRYRRRGEVTAKLRDTDWTWRTRAGEVMHGKAGDWAVVDDNGVERSVAAAVFESTHQQVSPDKPHRYRRMGTVRARRATRREVVTTLEGDAAAECGDWIVEGQGGERWPVSDEHFQKSYEGPVDDAEEAKIGRGTRQEA